jgi:hypothetical protein
MLVVPLKGRFSQSAWRTAIVGTIAHGRDLAVAVQSPPSRRFTMLAPYLSLLESVDKVPPSHPPRLRVSEQGPSTLRITWPPAVDRSPVRYRVFRNGKLITTVATAKATVTRPGTCKEAIRLSVVAVDTVGNAAAGTSTRVPCATKSIAGTAPAPGAPPGDVLPPAPILGLAVTATTSTSIGISWTPSSDNVGVSAYALYRDDVEVATTAGTTFTHTGLVCGASYRLAVAALDAAGNRSTPTSTTAGTSACGGGGGGGGGGTC